MANMVSFDSFWDPSNYAASLLEGALIKQNTVLAFLEGAQYAFSGAL